MFQVVLGSHPMWVRGLKLNFVRTVLQSPVVAPYVGAWIETYLYKREYHDIQSHPMWVRGLKQLVNHERRVLVSRTLCGCVD